MCVQHQLASYHVFQSTGLHRASVIGAQSEGFRFCGLQLFLLRENHSIKVGQRLSLELWHLRAITKQLTVDSSLQGLKTQ